MKKLTLLLIAAVALLLPACGSAGTNTALMKTHQELTAEYNALSDFTSGITRDSPMKEPAKGNLLNLLRTGRDRYNRLESKQRMLIQANGEVDWSMLMEQGGDFATDYFGTRRRIP